MSTTIGNEHSSNEPGAGRAGTGDPVLGIERLAQPWQTSDPFLFCVHHVDAYPAGNERMGPAADLGGRHLGHDFAGKDGWRMYHGTEVPGFPGHPHRGFETVTVVRRGFIDHADSLGGAARYGRGDVQWLTAGKGIVHSEMFPLIERAGPNPLELFQIWLNLPAADKLAEPHFAMYWSEAIPVQVACDAAGATTAITVVAGRLGETQAPPPPPSSWAARPDGDVAIWTIEMAAGARYTLPPAAPGSSRRLYFFRGEGLYVGERAIPPEHAIELRADVEAPLRASSGVIEMLLLQGRGIGEPVAQHGPFVMSSRAELEQAFLDYRRTRFGGWPWPFEGPVHPRHEGRFARHPGGRIERPDRATAEETR